MPIVWLCALLGLGLGLMACGENNSKSGTASTSPNVRSIAISGSARQFHVPATAALPAFRDFDVAFVARAAVAEPNAPVVLGQVGLQNAQASCSESGCSFSARGVALSDADAGLMAIVTPTAPDSGWLPTASYVVNPNQVQSVARMGSSLTTFGPAVVLPASALDVWAQGFGVDSNTLLARGVCLGLVWSSKQAESASSLPARSGAKVGLGGDSGAALRYPNGDYTALSAAATNNDGAFVIAGPQNPNTSAGLEIPLTIQPTQSNLRYINPKAVVRPGWVTVVPILTQL